MDGAPNPIERRVNRSGRGISPIRMNKLEPVCKKGFYPGENVTEFIEKQHMGNFVKSFREIKKYAVSRRTLVENDVEIMSKC